MRIPRFVVVVCGVIVLCVGGLHVTHADYESSEYVLDSVGWRSIPADGESSNYTINGSAGFGQANPESNDTSLHAGSTDTAFLPTPPAPLMSPVTTEVGAVHLTVRLGENDPHVSVQVRLIDTNQKVIYVAPNGAATTATTWNSYLTWGSSGKDIHNLAITGYVAQVRMRADDFSISEWSAESAVVTPVAKPSNPADSPLISIRLPESVQGIITSLQKKIRESGISGVAQALATALVPLTAIAALSQIATVGGFLFQIIFEIINRLFGTLLSGLQFFSLYKNRRVYGQVFDGISRRPLPGAHVELLRPDTRRLIDSQVTDDKGQYYFLSDQHVSYIVRVTHDHFDPFEKVVHGRVNIVVHLGLQLEYDTDQLRRRAKRALTLEKMNALRLWLLVIGTVAWGILFLGDQGGWLGYALGAYYVVAWSLELYVRRQPRPYGLVVDATSGNPLGLVVVRIQNKEGALVSTVVCDDRGRFATWLRPGEYGFNFTKAGYQPAVITDAHINRSLHSMEITAKMQTV